MKPTGISIGRRQFIADAAALGMAAAVPGICAGASLDDIDRWQNETEQVSPEVYRQYMIDGDTRGFASLDKLEKAFDKVLREVKATLVGDFPAVWSVYNMGYIVKTRESVFSIDLVHRRDSELVSLMDFALVTHNHSDHWRADFCQKMAELGKPVVSNFLGFKGYTRAKAIAKIRDVEIRTSLIDHNDWLIDFTTAFEIRVGNWTMYHTGDSGRGTEPKLETVWGRPDLWLFFPGCGINTAKAVAKVDAKRIVFGHLWELDHKQNHRGRLDEPLIRSALAQAAKVGHKQTSLAFWGDRIV